MIEHKLLARGLSLALIGAVLWPIRENWRAEPKDDFPLSYYPMFSAKRKSRVRVTYLVGLDSQGQRSILPYTLVAGGGMNQVRRQIRRLAQRGQADQVCQSAMRRIVRSAEERYAGIVTVQVVTGSYNLSRYFGGDPAPREERVHASLTRQEYFHETTALQV